MALIPNVMLPQCQFAVFWYQGNKN